VSSPVYSTRLFTALALEDTQSITTEDGFVTVVRDIDVVVYDNSEAAFFAWSGDEGQLLWYFENAAGADTTFQWRGRQVFAAGLNMAWAISTGKADITVSGYKLTLP
jgi:hypothetical protein